MIRGCSSWRRGLELQARILLFWCLGVLHQHFTIIDSVPLASYNGAVKTGALFVQEFEVSLVEVLTFDAIPRSFVHRLVCGKENRLSLRRAFHMMHSEPMPEAIYNACSSTNVIRLLGPVLC